MGTMIVWAKDKARESHKKDEEMAVWSVGSVSQCVPECLQRRANTVLQKGGETEER